MCLQANTNLSWVEGCSWGLTGISFLLYEGHKPPSSCFGALPLPHFPSLWLGWHPSAPKFRWHQRMVQRQAYVPVGQSDLTLELQQGPGGKKSPLGLSSFQGMGHMEEESEANMENGTKREGGYLSP